MRNLTKTIAVLSFILPASAYPLGIGEIKLHSALNQKLDAEIDLILSQNETISDIRVRLAPPEKFDEAGVPWNYFLSKIKFTPVEQRNGSTIVKLSSSEVLREPFLDFLVEVSWAKGNLYREFTVLVDPPTSYTQPTIPVIQNAKQEVQTWPAIPVEAAKVVYETLTSQYGPTNSSDSLWKVAEKTNIYDDVSIEQMMMAIYKANPNAFFKENVNALMAHKVLEIPEREVLLQLSKRQAAAAFNKQNIAWNGRIKENNQEQQSVADDFENTAQLELEAPVEAEINDAVIVISETEMSDLAVIQSEPEKESERVLASDGVIALQTRMETLEHQLELMQKRLVLKDEKIAALQNQKRPDTVAEPANIQSDSTETKNQPFQQQRVHTPKVAVDISAEKKTEDSLKIKAVDKIKEKVVKKPKEKIKVKPEPVVQQESDTENYLTLILSSFGVAILGLFGFFWWHKNKEEELTESESMFASASEISMPDSSVEELSLPVTDDTSYDVGTVGESSFLSEFTPSDFDAFDTDHDEIDPISEADVYLAYGRYQQAEDLMRQAISAHPDRDECKLKLLEIFYANENKTAFLEFADELVKTEKHNDHEFWAKVIEMGAELDPGNSMFMPEAGGKANFDNEILSESSESVITYNAEESVALKEKSNEDTLIDNAANKDEAIISTDSPVTESDNEIDFDLSGFDITEDEKIVEQEVKVDENNPALDFDLSSFDVDESAVDGNDDLDENEVESVDFDLSSVALSDPADLTESQEIIEKQSDNSLDFDLSIFDQQTSADDQIAANSNENADVISEEETESFEFDLTSEHKLNDGSLEVLDLSSELETDESLENFDFSLDAETPDTKEADPVESDKSQEEIESFEFDFDSILPPSDTKTSTDQKSDVSDLTDMDELETKIDLAKAYIDMGDTEAAKIIADEVLEKGNEDQKKTAQAIMDQLK